MTKKEIVKEIHINGDETQQGQQQQLHLINCKLEKSQVDLKIDQFFTSQMKLASNNAGSKGKAKSSSEMKVSFRGRPLNGKKVQLPKGFVFAQMCKSENKNTLIASNISKEMTYWNLDKMPSSSDPVPQMFQWLQLSADIHSHVQLADD